MGAAGKQCSVSLKQQIAALHLQSSSLGQPHCVQASDCQSVSGSETNRLLKKCLSLKSSVNGVSEVTVIYFLTLSHSLFSFSISSEHIFK